MRRCRAEVESLVCAWRHLRTFAYASGRRWGVALRGAIRRSSYPPLRGVQQRRLRVLVSSTGVDVAFHKHLRVEGYAPRGAYCSLQGARPAVCRARAPRPAFAI
eukprot:10986266-Lingulodinium_polyedra.AAC.1